MSSKKTKKKVIEHKYYKKNKTNTVIMKPILKQDNEEQIEYPKFQLFSQESKDECESTSIDLEIFDMINKVQILEPHFGYFDNDDTDDDNNHLIVFIIITLIIINLSNFFNYK